MRVVYCVVLILLLAYSAEAQSEREHPKCRTTNCQWDDVNSHNFEFIFYVNGTTGVRDKPNQQVIVWYKDMDSFLLWCNSHPLQTKNRLPVDDPALPAVSRPLRVKIVEIRGCTVPLNSSYHDVLAALNVTFLSQNENTTLKLTELPAEPRLEGYHMEGLPIKKLLITAYNNDQATRPKFDFFDKIQELQTLELKENVVLGEDVIEHLPQGLVTLKLDNTQLPVAESKLNNGSFWLERLRSLNFLSLVESREIPTDLEKFKLIPPPLASLPNLTTAGLYYIPLKLLRQNWLKGSKLETLILKSCGIKKLPDNLFNGANLKKLHLINNSLSSLPKGVFSPLQWLKELDLSSNNLSSVDLRDTLAPLTRLETLKVNKNMRLGSLCGGSSIIQGKQSSKLPKSLRHLELIKTGATRICDDWIESDLFLTYLALDSNEISNLRYSDLMMMRDASITNMTPVTLSLRKNPSLKMIRFTQDDYNSCLDARTRDWGNPKPVQVKLKLDKVACDCYDGYWLRETLRHCPLLALEQRDITCFPKPAFEPRSLLAFKPDDFTCPYDSYCTPGCKCQRRAFDNATVVRCTGALPSEPQWPPSTPEWPLALHVPPGTLDAVPRVALVELYAPRNNITKLDEEDISPTLRVLDVRNNKITHITPDAAQRLLNKRANGSRVWISENPLACDCEDAPAIAKLKLAEVLDWNITKCIDGNYVMGKIKIDMCESKVMAPSLGVTATVLIIIVVALVLRRLSPYIRQFLFDHNMCLKLVLKVKDDPYDPTKTHDVFISYSYNDYEYAKKLIEKLEDHGYSTIEHCRDWLPGKSVTQQITHSVMSARRTLLLVSDNFANSKWGLEEFHAAHAHAMEHGSARVIVVRCKLLAPHELPPELQLYLYNNTYLDWSDRYFWDKLWRVMPTPRPTPTTAIALIPNQDALPSIRIQLTPQKPTSSAMPQMGLSVDKDPPLSELVLVPPIGDSDSPRQPSVRTPSITSTTRQPLSSNKNITALPRKIQQERLKSPVIPAAVSPCAC